MKEQTREHLESIDDKISILAVLVSALIAESGNEIRKHILDGMSELKGDTDISKEFIDVMIQGIKEK